VLENLKPAFLYTLWADNENYLQVTKPAYSRVCRFPSSLWLPSRIRNQKLQGLVQGSNPSKIDLLIRRRGFMVNAKKCMNTLDLKLASKKGKSIYFFGLKPSLIDALLFGYFSVLMSVPLQSFELKSHFNSCKNLKIHYETICALYHKSANFTRDKDYSKNGNIENILVEAKNSYAVNKDVVVTFGIGAGIMMSYAILCGIFTSERSKLAKFISAY